ncbi:hypothetical protein [Winogradskya humida]|uniref:PepSY-associated transmembrane protein n=1 Tax=Winogradskya humida TaxID=113566 RepID=A0ABQ4A6S4_9ACTN|nr:hypothetical protein [Actinoplanes humidus]GIE26541.1 hypothetical protein Ahu01nite_096430 [Actinoplanes humidus]
MAYAWVLLAYPRDYRREHGGELLEPVLAEGRRPRIREAANLFLHGLRTRLGRPASRTVVAWALSATVIAGLLGAAAGSWAGWQTARPLPAPEWTRALLADVLPGHDFSTIDPPATAPFEIPDGNAADLLLGRGGDYRATTTGASVLGLPADADPDALIGVAVTRLTATGWAVRAPVHTVVYDCLAPPCEPAYTSWTTRVEATRDGLALTLEATPAFSDDDATARAEFSRTTPPGAWFGGVAAGLPAAVVAFLLFGWASRRTGRPGHPARLAVLFPGGLALICWWAPALTAFSLIASDRQPQLWEWLGQPRYSLSFLTGAPLAALSLLLAALAPRPELVRATARPTGRGAAPGAPRR